MPKLLYQENLDEEAVCASCGKIHGPVHLNCSKHGEMISVIYHPNKGYLDLICLKCGKRLAMIAVASRQKIGSC